MTIQKASRFTLVGQVAEQMEQMIESGQWQVGEKIPAEPKLMEQFDVSRNTLREAIQSLVHAGLLETRQGIGTTVKSDSNLGVALERKIKKSDLFETLEVRLGFEREAAQLAAERRTTEDLEQIQCYLDKCNQTLKNNDMSQFAKLDLAFHKSIVKATHNGMFIELYEHITDALQNSIEEFVDIKSQGHVENGIHTDLFHAIRLGDKQWALECVNAYLDDAKESLSLRWND